VAKPACPRRNRRLSPENGQPCIHALPSSGQRSYAAVLACGLIVCCPFSDCRGRKHRCALVVKESLPRAPPSRAPLAALGPRPCLPACLPAPLLSGTRSPRPMGHNGILPASVRGSPPQSGDWPAVLPKRFTGSHSPLVMGRCLSLLLSHTGACKARPMAFRQSSHIPPPAESNQASACGVFCSRPDHLLIRSVRCRKVLRMV
jgi:hypothetical protein